MVCGEHLVQYYRKPLIEVFSEPSRIEHMAVIAVINNMGHIILTVVVFSQLFVANILVFLPITYYYSIPLYS